MDYRINRRALQECLAVMEMQYKKMEFCYEELYRAFSPEYESEDTGNMDLPVRECQKDMEMQMQEIWRLRRILERVLSCEAQWEQKVLEKLEGKKRRIEPKLGRIPLGHLSEKMEELQIWIQ